MKGRLGAILSLMALSGGLFAQPAPAQPSAQAETLFQISGVLLDAVTGQPISQARVAIAPLSQRDAYITLTTGEDGRFLFRSLKAGNYTLGAQRRGYLTRSYDQHDQFSSYIAVGPDLESSNLIFRLPPECAISGRVSDEAGESVSDAQVLLYKSGNTQGEQATRLITRNTTDSEGLYHFTHLQPGKYFVAVVAKVWYAQRPMPARTTVTFQDGGVTTNLPTPPGTYPEEHGRSSLDVAYPITFYPGVTEASGATPIVINSGDRYVADIMLQPVPALHFQVPKEESPGTGGGSSSFLQLKSRPFDSLPVAVETESRTLGSGEMEIMGIAPGHYQFEISRNDGKNTLNKSGELNAMTDGEVGLETEAQLVDVSATVQLDSGSETAMQGTLVLYRPRTTEGVVERFTGVGEIKFKRPVEPGTYQVSLNSNAGVFIKNLAATGARVNGRMLEVKGPGPVHLTVALAHGEAEIKGVALRDGKPFSGAMIVLVPENPVHNHVLFRRDQSNTDGSFMLAAVVPGKYTLLALEHCWDLEWMNPSVLKSYLSAGEILQVQENGKYEVKAKVQ